LNPHGGNKQEQQTGHGTQKPIEVMRRPIVNHTKTGDSVYDPFLGSGTTLIAAEITERVCYGLEIDPRYVDVIVTRWRNLTGKQAILEGHGTTFEQACAARLAAGGSNKEHGEERSADSGK
jgi:DNA modification methylase